MEEKVNTPMEEKVKENNTDINNTFNNNIVLIIEYLNSICGTNYKPTSKTTRRLIVARLKEHYTVDDFKKVIFTMSSKWKGTKFEQYLRPSTLFNEDKFEGYLNQYKNIGKSDNSVPSSKVEKFNSMASHDWDFDELENMQRDHIREQLKKEGRLSE